MLLAIFKDILANEVLVEWEEAMEALAAEDAYPSERAPYKAQSPAAPEGQAL